MTLDKLKSLDKDDLLNLLGLETRRGPTDYLVPTLTLFGVGLLVGTGIGLLVAQRPGKELREDIARRVHEAPEAISQIPHRANEAMHRVTDQIAEKMHDAKA